MAVIIITNTNNDSTEKSYTICIEYDIGHKLRVVAVAPARHETLQCGWVWVAVHVDKEGWRHEVRRQLSLLVQHKLVGVAHKWTVVGVEEQLLRHLLDIYSDTCHTKMRVILYLFVRLKELFLRHL